MFNKCFPEMMRLLCGGPRKQGLPCCDSCRVSEYHQDGREGSSEDHEAYDPSPFSVHRTKEQGNRSREADCWAYYVERQEGEVEAEECKEECPDAKCGQEFEDIDCQRQPGPRNKSHGCGYSQGPVHFTPVMRDRTCQVVLHGPALAKLLHSALV